VKEREKKYTLFKKIMYIYNNTRQCCLVNVAKTTGVEKMTIKKGNLRVWVTLNEKLLADIVAAGYSSPKDIIFFLKIAATEKIERLQQAAGGKK